MKQYSEEKLYNTIDKILDKIEVLEKKKKLWGLAKEDGIKLLKLKFEYLKYYSILIDKVFVDYVEPVIYTEEIIDLKSRILMESKWEGQLLIIEEDINEFIKNVRGKEEEIIDMINELRMREIKEIADLEDNIISEEIFKLFSELPGMEGEEEDYKINIIEYVMMKYDVMLSLLEDRE